MPDSHKESVSTIKPVSRQAAMSRQSICIVVPVLNEEKNIRPTVEILLRALAETISDNEIIIINDGSTDRTKDVIEQLVAENRNVRAIHEERNRGIGHAYMSGYRLTRCDHFVYIPGDNTWPYESCRQLFSQLGRADVVTSYALNPEVRPLGRRMLSPLYTACLNALFGRHMHYYNGLNIYPVSFLRSRPRTAFDFGFQAEVLLQALDAGLSYVEVGLMIDERTAGGSKAIRFGNIVNVVTTIVRLVYELKIRPRR